MPRPMNIPAPIRWLAAAVLVIAGLSLGVGPAAASAPPDSTISGTLQYRSDGEKVLVEGVTVTATNEAGDEVGSATSAADGTFSIPVPGVGTYVVTLDTATLPDGVGILEGQTNESTVTLTAPGNKGVAFRLSDGSTAGPSDQGDKTILALQLFVDGVKLGLIIAMCAVGLSLIYGTTGLVNFAHGEMVTLGGMVALLLNVTFGIHVLIATPIAMVVGGVAGGLFNEVVWAPLRRSGASLIAGLVVSIGFSILFRYTFLYIVGGQPQFLEQYQAQKKIYFFGLFALSPKELIVMGLSVAVLIAVAIALQATKAGKAMRAVADNRDLAESSGIDVENVIRLVWIVGAALAALGGVFFGLIENVNWDFGFRLLLLMFAGITLGGLGTAYGALFGSLVIGILIQMSTLSVGPVPGVPSELKNVGALLLLVVILLVRPQGILGRAERIG